MHITTDGLVLRTRAMDESDSILTLLTKDCGVISAYARGARKPRSALKASVELLSYSCFVLFQNKERYSVDRADLNRLFMGVRGDVEKLSLASYFCELAAELAPRGEEAGEVLRLLLNSLHLLDCGKRDCLFLKPVFELRLMTMAGFMPDLIGCRGCGRFEADAMLFLPLTGELCCGECAAALPPNTVHRPVAKGGLAAMRHILYSEPEKLFSFSLPKPALEQLSELTQHYIIVQLDRKFDTLEFYLGISKPLKGIPGAAQDGGAG